MIKVVIFDFGGTLVRGKLDEQGYRQRLLDYIHNLGYSVNEHSLRKVIEGTLVRLTILRSCVGTANGFRLGVHLLGC